MELPHGPHKVTVKRQVAIPAALMKRLRLEIGDLVYFQASEDHDGCILVVPAEVAARWWAAGQRLPGAIVLAPAGTEAENSGQG